MTPPSTGPCLTPLLAVCPAAAVANQSDSVATSLETVLRLGLALAVVLLVFWFCTRLVQRLQGASKGGQGTLRVVATLPVGQRERLLIVAVGEQQMLLGATSQQICLLQTLDAPIPDVADSFAGASLSFSRVLAAVRRPQAEHEQP